MMTGKHDSFIPLSEIFKTGSKTIMSKQKVKIMKWQEICENRLLWNLPFKSETNEYGQIVMSPVKYYHSKWAGRAARMLVQITSDQYRREKTTLLRAWCERSTGLQPSGTDSVFQPK